LLDKTWNNAFIASYEDSIVFISFEESVNKPDGKHPNTMSTPTPSEAEAVEPTKNNETLCSVLNVVIDHSMEAPTPLEAIEWRSPRRDQLRVPVVRVFGPVLRTTQPRQSACLYIHGAFPYMLARPVWAGPDGSLRRAKPEGGNVDWDDVKSVQAISDTIASTLESSLLSLELGGRNNNNKNTNDKDKQQKDPKDIHPFIRQVTVVEGRGFYTYCPGPPAPFLRVEYYNPKLRWKVKLMLEKGLEVPMMYHPDPTLYDRPMEPPGDALKFNCYEAHIPYTMQFFKDKNLAGMSYIHIADGRLRGKLPERHFNKRYHRSSDNISDENDELVNSIFLKSNTPKRFLWEETKVDEFSTPPLHQPSSSTSPDEATPTTETTMTATAIFQPPKKQTSSDIEIDCTVDDLRNIETVLKSLPSEQEERDRIQWRAVPSLQEIWRQERLRMAKLLPPKHDFLSGDRKDDGAFTLNPKKHADRSGARLAAKGMWSLVGLTDGLGEDFLRVLHDILERHKRAVRKADEALRKKKEGEQANGGRKKIELTPDWDEAFDALASLPNAKEQGPGVNLTPDWDEAIGALDSLVAQAPTSSPVPGSAPQEDFDSPGSLFEDKKEEETLQSSIEDSGDGKSSRPPSYSCSQEMQDASATAFDNINLEEYCQRLERGDGVVDDPGHELEDFIDPETLRPYEELYFGEERCRIIFHVKTDSRGNDRICGGNYANCARHSDCPSGARAKTGYYKTMNSGACVDGILNNNSHHVDLEDEDDVKFEHELSMLATQTQMQEAQIGTQPTQKISASDVVGQFPRNTANGRPFESSNTHDSDGESDDASGESSSAKKAVVESRSGHEEESPALPDEGYEITYPVCVAPKSLPPTRKAVSDTDATNGLHPKESSNNPPSWLLHSSTYSASRESICSKSRIPSEPPNISSTQSISIRSSKVPPTRRKVARWCKKNPSSNPRIRKRRKSREDVSKSSKRAKKKTLEIDSNSRKLIATDDTGDNLIGADFQCNIEDVKWGQSQPWQLSMTQQTQNNYEPLVEPAPRNAYIQEESQKTFPDTPDSSSKTQGGSISRGPSQNSGHALDGIGNQGGRIHVQGGGGLKAKTRPSQGQAGPQSSADQSSSDNDQLANSFLPSPVSFMSIEIHVQCRTGSSRLDSKKISMAPDSNKDKIFLVVYILGLDPGGGESLDILSRGCIFVPLPTEDLDRDAQVRMIQCSMPRATLGATAPLNVECVNDERSLLLRLASIVRMKDPDMLLSWDTQGAGLGYLIERGAEIGSMEKQTNESASSNQVTGVDMVRLLGRTPHDKSSSQFLMKASAEKLLETSGDQSKLPNSGSNWRGSGLGSEWDERVGAGAAASSIVSFASWTSQR
jgi:hypothetical protein